MDGIWGIDPFCFRYRSTRPRPLNFFFVPLSPFCLLPLSQTLVGVDFGVGSSMRFRKPRRERGTTGLFGACHTWVAWVPGLLVLGYLATCTPGWGVLSGGRDGVSRDGREGQSQRAAVAGCCRSTW